MVDVFDVDGLRMTAVDYMRCDKGPLRFADYPDNRYP